MGIEPCFDTGHFNFTTFDSLTIVIYAFKITRSKNETKNDPNLTQNRKKDLIRLKKTHTESKL